MSSRPSSRALPARVLVGAVAAVISVTALAGCAGTGGGNGPSGSDNRYVSGDGGTQFFTDRSKGPQAGGTTLDGKAITLADYKGKVVVVNFWASWCGPCRAEAPELVAVADRTKDQRVSFVGIDIRDDRDKAKAFVEGKGVTYPSVFDPAGQTALDFAKVPPTAIPSTLIVDRQGRVAALYTKALLREELESAVRKVAAE